MPMPVLDIIEHIRERQDPGHYQDLHWEGSFQEYLEMVQDNPVIARNAFQRLHDMILTFGTRKYTEYKKEITHYNFFDDPMGNGKDAIFGRDLPLMKFVQPP
jgi:serine protein kinase